MQPFFIDETFSAAFLANIAGRIREVINDDCTALLAKREIITPITDVSLLLFVEKNSGCNMADIARGLAHSHQRVSARMKALLKLQLIEKTASEKDNRSLCFTLTEAGQKDAVKLAEVYTSAATELEKLFREIDCDLVEKLMAAVTSLQRFPLSQRIESSISDKAHQTH